MRGWAWRQGQIIFVKTLKNKDLNVDLFVLLVLGDLMWRKLISWGRGERLLQTNFLIGQEGQLPSYDWTRATESHTLSNQNASLY